MHVDRLRLVGFKSFVEEVDLPIHPGLTGIVGPNGCGKSNLVEALRWVMGEVSARRLRGGEMDDVIFGGSAGRPSRNIAEVALTLHNNGRDAPLPFNDREEIEVVRRIERGAGSVYRLNGREVRARDIQLLFADAATGAHSAAHVSQGRVGALIAAKPSERRTLLDEAAGTAGLHARRHEAELKLKAAEDNLLRVDDLIGALAIQLDGLKKQARQAQRYRRLAEQIRRSEAALLHARWRAAEAESARIATERRGAERAVAAATEAALAAQRGRAEAEAALPSLRRAEAEAVTRLQQLAHAREALESELQRIIVARADAERRHRQVEADIKREDELLRDAEAALRRLSEERDAAALAEARDVPGRDDTEARLRQAAAELAAAETRLQQMTEASATGEARRAALQRHLRDIAERRSRVQMRIAESERQRHALAGTAVPPEVARTAAAAVTEAEQRAERCRNETERLVDALAASQAIETHSTDAAREAERRLARLRAEAEAIGAMLAPTAAAGADEEATVLSLLRVPDGLEAAIGALFEDELASPLLAEWPSERRASEPPWGWRELPPWALEARLEQPGLPAGAELLADAVHGPGALCRRLGLSGLVDSAETGWRLQPDLAAGQCLVDREGHLWRWDGYVRTGRRPSAAEQHLKQRNRLAGLMPELAEAEAAAEQAARDAAAARSAREAAVAAERRGAGELRQADAHLAQTRAAEAELARRALTAETRLAALADTAEKLAVELAELAVQAEAQQHSLALLPDPALARAEVESARAEVTALRRCEAEARSARDEVRREAEARRTRLSAIDGETLSWRKRRDDGAVQRGILAEREAALLAEISALAARPAAIAAESETLAAASGVAAEQRRATGDSLAQGESRWRQAGEASRQAERVLTEAREQRARLDVLDETATETLARLRAEIRERIGTAPAALAALAAIDPGAEMPDLAETAARLDRLLRERDNLGAVNLLAEEEMVAVESRIAGLRHERGELTEAIRRLRRGLDALDQEGRRRLLAAFERLNEHFAALFARLFGGGNAHLALEEAADPLGAGLEIMASPPGKRLQSLSLLSGGEQALTAIALLFAVFLTKPAPVCVLDEVDAPLDDANVDRFCRLVAETADASGTRFLVVTHHRITMARMDRLFGVTMPERGVSQLVSVDLARAAQLRQTA
ncbi:MAG: chromosome segregation protein SMC [Alphaproteobacteria bacterium]|nr:chromosome segregation protein SMC [Alphaproteobacteria bacterium]